MRILQLILFLLLINFGYSQNPYHLTIDKSTGLPSNSVYDIFQDSKGFMWFATGKGICQYDGTYFKNYTADFQTSKSGSCLTEDSFGRIWYTNFDGYLYYVEKGVLKALNQPATLGYFKFGIIKDALYLIQPNAVFIYDLKTLKLKLKYKINDNTIKACYTSNNTFYVLGHFLYEFNSNLKPKKHKLPSTFNDEIIGPIINSWNGKLIINSKSNTTYYSFEKGIFTKFINKSLPNFIQNTSVIGNYIWVCTPNGIFKNNIHSNASNAYFKNLNISYIFKDKHQNYWISTLDKGIIFVENFDNTYIDLLPRPLSLTLGKKEIYIGTDKELIYTLECKSHLFKKIFETESNHSIGQIFGDTINDKLFFTSTKFTILNNKNQITNEFAIAVKEVKQIDNKYFSFAASGVNGIFYVDEKLKSSWDYLFNKNKTTEFSGFNQSCLLNKTNGKSTEYLSSNNTIYYATNNGLIAVSNDGKSTEIKYKNETLYLISIQKYKNQIIGLSTNDKLYIINSQNKVSPFILPNNINNEKIIRFRIIENYCYLFAANGIYEYDFKTKKAIKVVSSSSELEATDVVLKNNKLLFATSKGIVIKNRSEIKNYPKPNLIINEIQINGKRREPNEITKLSTNENDVSINFSTLSYIPNENYAVFYKINNSEWKTLSNTNKSLKLSALSPGNYTVLLALNYNNQKIDVQKIELTICKPFWLTNFFQLFLVLCLLFLFYSYYKFQIRKIKNQNKLLLEKQELERNLNLSTLKAIKAQMNPHFFFNALNTIQSYIATNETEEASEYLNKFSKLTRMILEMTEKNWITIDDEIKMQSLYLNLQKIRLSHFDFQINIENNRNVHNATIPTMLLQPYIENAVIHGLAHKVGIKNLWINIEINNQNQLEIIIKDNGIGLTKANEINSKDKNKNTSFATKATLERLEIINRNDLRIAVITNELFDSKENSQGTEVIITMDLRYE